MNRPDENYFKKIQKNHIYFNNVSKQRMRSKREYQDINDSVVSKGSKFKKTYFKNDYPS